MLQELLYRCKDDSKPLPDKPTLLADCLKAVLPICNKGNDAKNIKKNLSKIVESTKEAQMYRPFTEVSNLAFDRLSKINPPGLLRSKAHDDEKILFHQNDPKNIIQKHQGEASTRRPDVVIVSRTSAKKVSKHPDQPYKDEQALEKPAKRFQWTDVRSTVEFKHNKLRTGVSNPPKTYAVNAYDVPEAKKYMKYRRETNDTAKATDVTPLPGSSAATSSRQTSDARTSKLS
ncbi:hypothetical protein BDR04DRAFT_242994 [Suillus decipiens]|nr:hypothetical protein BDR04DRAFT_242994 [Suillus decipiens]